MKKIIVVSVLLIIMFSIGFFVGDNYQIKLQPEKIIYNSKVYLSINLDNNFEFLDANFVNGDDFNED